MSINSISEEGLRSIFVEEYNKQVDMKIHLEVPVFSRSVDLVMQNVIDATISAIEFKLHDWKRAILQAQRVSICFDYLYICIPKPKTLKGYQSVVKTCESSGIGLYLYDSDTKTFEKPLDSPKIEAVWSAQKHRVLGYLEDKQYE